ncbi:MAG: AAA family ATPase [Eubacteriales bacterium]
MKIITISREFGSGGREIGKRLADLMKFDYYDSEILTAVAKNSGMDKDYVENRLSNHGWQEFSITYGATIDSADYARSSGVNLLLKQKDVLEEIAKLGKDCVIIGRNADVILSPYNPFNIFVCADTDAKIKRCMRYSEYGENLTEKDLVRKMKQIDRQRSQTRAILSGSGWGKRDAYHLIVNTTGWEIKELTPAIKDFANRWFDR